MRGTPLGTLRRALLGALACAMCATPATAQDLATLRDELPDSTSTEYPYLFPIWGEKVVERGFEIPYPFGVSANFLGQRFDVVLEDLKIGLNGGELVALPIVEFESADVRLITGNVRADLWVLPFLNVSLMYGDGRGTTRVDISEPLAFGTDVEYRGTYYGWGVLGAFGFDDWFFTLDLNQTWFDSSILGEPVIASVGGLRAGHAFRVGGRNLNVWGGAMYQNYGNLTNGTVTGADILPPDLGSGLDGYQETEWYQDLGRPQKLVVDRVVEAIRSGALDDLEIGYSLNKRPARPWNVLLGARYEFSKTWELRAELGFIGREQGLVSLAYRWPW